MTSTIKVNKLEQRTGCTATVGGGAGKTVTVDATTVTLGRCGGTVSLASGASQSGFGRTGTVDWQTGAIKTGDFNAVDGQGFFVDTNGGAVVATLPSGSAGSIVSFQDYRNTFDSNRLRIVPQSGQKINGGGDGLGVNITTEGRGVTFVYIDSTVGWRSVQDNDFSLEGASFICASGGTITCSGDFKIHTFTSTGTFVVNSLSADAPNNFVSYAIVAGGGGGSGGTGAGAGAGGFRESRAANDTYNVSPLNASSGPTYNIPVVAQTYPITIGAGGRGGGYGPSASNPAASGANNGSPSVFNSITSTGGGGAGTGSPNSSTDGQPGGSAGGGNGGYGAPSYPGGAGNGNDPPVSPAQGTNGGGGVIVTPGAGGGYAGGGGGGATAAGAAAVRPSGAAGDGGAGASTSISGSSTAYAGGGGGTAGNPTANHGSGGSGGGGAGVGPNVCGNAGTANTGGGGGGIGSACGSTPPRLGGLGGSGVVIIRYKAQ